VAVSIHSRPGRVLRRSDEAFGALLLESQDRDLTAVHRPDAVDREREPLPVQWAQEFEREGRIVQHLQVRTDVAAHRLG
jgi:hypothetical protein